MRTRGLPRLLAALSLLALLLGLLAPRPGAAYPPGPFVRSIQRTGTTASLVPAEAALVFDPASFTVTDQPAALLSDVNGGQVTGYTSVALAGLSLGSGTSQVTVGSALSAATSSVTLASVIVPTGKAARIQLHVTAAINVAALGYWTFAEWSGTVAVISGGLALTGGANNDAAGTFIGSPFGVSSTVDFAGLTGTAVGNVETIQLAPIDLATAYTGITMPSGAWAQSKAVTGTVQGSGTALGVGSNNTILSANSKWYFYTAGTTSNTGTGPSHTSGSAADGTATAYYGGTVAAGVPMVVTVTWRQIEVGP